MIPSLDASLILKFRVPPSSLSLSLSPSPALLLSSALLGRSRFRLQPHELLGHVVVGALRQDAHGGEAGVVHVDALAQRTPAGAVALLHDVPQLDDGQAHHPVGAAEAVVLDADLQLVALEAVLVPQSTAEGEGSLNHNVHQEKLLQIGGN